MREREKMPTDVCAARYTTPVQYSARNTFPWNLSENFRDSEFSRSKCARIAKNSRANRESARENFPLSASLQECIVTNSLSNYFTCYTSASITR